jgi:hypothetical protein
VIAIATAIYLLSHLPRVPLGDDRGPTAHGIARPSEN